jgi:EcsC family protein
MFNFPDGQCLSPHPMPMTENHKKSWLRRRIENGLVSGLTRAYETVKVNPDKFLIQLHAAYDLPITSFEGVYAVELNYLDEVASSIVRSSVKMAAVQGAGFGLGGVLTLAPDLGFLSAITMRTIQKLSLLYGFEFNTEDEMAELWIAAASAAGVDISRELLEKEVISRFIPRVIQRIAAQASGEVVEKWVGRLVPVASSLIGAGLNYYFVRTWGQRAAAHFRQRHLETRRRLAVASSSRQIKVVERVSSNS